jgi:hypothetical protein
LSWLKTEDAKPKNREIFRYEQQIGSNSKVQHSNDILEELSKATDKRKEENSIPLTKKREDITKLKDDSKSKKKL